jgi:pimeloyl-ACP methyl ester carboxylesterase
LAGRRTRHRPPDRCYPAWDARVGARFVTLRSGLRVRAVEAGPADGVPVVLLPGWGASAFAFRYQLPALAAVGYRAVAVDLKGLGFSAKPTGRGEYVFDAMMRHVEEILDAVARGPSVLVGQSMAGPLALELARSRPSAVSAIALVSPVGLGVVPFIGLARFLTPRALDLVAPYLVRRSTVRVALSAAYGRPSRVSEDTVEEYWAPAQDGAFARALRALVHDFDWSQWSEQRLAALMVPTLVIRATLDRLVRGPPRRNVPGVERMELVIVDDAGHAVQEERPDAVNAAVLAFLDRVRPPRP